MLDMFGEKVKESREETIDYIYHFFDRSMTGVKLGSASLIQMPLLVFIIIVMLT